MFIFAILTVGALLWGGFIFLSVPTLCLFSLAEPAWRGNAGLVMSQEEAESLMTTIRIRRRINSYKESALQVDQRERYYDQLLPGRLSPILDTRTRRFGATSEERQVAQVS